MSPKARGGRRGRAHASNTSRPLSRQSWASQSAVTRPAGSRPRYWAGRREAMGRILLDRQAGELRGPRDTLVQRGRGSRQPRRAGLGDPSVLAQDHRLAGEFIGPGRGPRHRCRVAHQEGALRGLGPDHRLDRGGRQVVPVHNQGGRQFVGGELFPEDIGMPGQLRRATVAQVRGERRPRLDGIPDLRRRRRRVPDRHANPRPRQILDQHNRSRGLGRQGHQPDPARRRLLPPQEVVDRGGRHAGARMRPPRTVFRRDIRAFHVQAGHRAVLRLDERFRAPCKALERGSDQRREESRHSPRAQLFDRSSHLLRRGAGIIEVHPAKAVDLQVEQSGKLDSHKLGPRAPIPSTKR